MCRGRRHQKMAFSITGGLILRTFKPILVNPCYVIESTTSLQVRHAKRKGYREKIRRAKAKAKLAEKPVSQEIIKIRKKIGAVEKTVDFDDRPDPPDDDTYIENLFKIKKFSVAEAVKFHQEYHHPTVYNNPDAPVIAKFELNLDGKKKTGLRSILGVVSIPYPFKDKEAQDIMVLCDTEFVDLALKNGAAIAGGEKLVEKIKDGSVQPGLYEFILCHMSFLPKITPIRGLLKDKLPKIKEGTLTSDIKDTLNKFLFGIRYHAVVLESPPDFGVMDCQIGVISQDPNQIEENFKALMEDLSKIKTKKGVELIHWIWCTSPPSKERFAIDVTRYMKKEAAEEDDDDEDDDAVGGKGGKMNKRKTSKVEEEEEEEEEEVLSQKEVKE